MYKNIRPSCKKLTVLTIRSWKVKDRNIFKKIKIYGKNSLVEKNPKHYRLPNAGNSPEGKQAKDKLRIKIASEIFTPLVQVDNGIK